MALVVDVVFGETVVSKNSLLRLFAEVLDFPDYFGMNWDAFDECFAEYVSSTASDVIINHRGVDYSGVDWFDTYKDLICELSNEHNNLFTDFSMKNSI